MSLIPEYDDAKAFIWCAFFLMVVCVTCFPCFSGCESKIQSARYESSKAASEATKIAIENGYEQDRNGYWVKIND